MGQAVKSGFGLHISVSNCTITMYSNCGQLIEAKAFYSVAVKNVMSWN